MSVPQLFDTRLVQLHRQRARHITSDAGSLWEKAAEALLERLEEIKKTFETVLVFGECPGLPARNIVRLEQLEDDSWFPAAEVDAVIGVGALHWVNDVPGTLVKFAHALKPDGLLLITLPGGETLRELREAAEYAEMETLGGLSPRVSPMLDVRDAGNLLQRAGFALPVVDMDRVTLSYSSPLALMQDLRALGETNALVARAKVGLRKSTLAALLDYYSRHFPYEGGVAATVDMVTMIAWKPAATQPQPAKRGSGKMSLKDALS